MLGYLSKIQPFFNHWTMKLWEKRVHHLRISGYQRLDPPTSCPVATGSVLTNGIPEKIPHAAGSITPQGEMLRSKSSVWLRGWLGESSYLQLMVPKDPITEPQMMIRVYNHLLSKVFRLHYHSQKVIGSLGGKFWWFGIRIGMPLSTNPFHFRGSNRNPNHRAPNHQFTNSSIWPHETSICREKIWLGVLHTVDGRNPPPPGMCKNLVNNGINYISTGEPDFFHQQYLTSAIHYKVCWLSKSKTLPKSCETSETLLFLKHSLVGNSSGLHRSST